MNGKRLKEKINEELKKKIRGEYIYAAIDCFAGGYDFLFEEVKE